METRSYPVVKRVFIVNGAHAVSSVAEMLSAYGIPSVVLDIYSASSFESPVRKPSTTRLFRTIQGGRLLKIEGHIGRFRILVQENGGDEQWYEAGFVVLEDVKSIPPCPIVPSCLSHDHVLALEEMERLADPGSRELPPKAIGIWFDPEDGVPDKNTAIRALRACRNIKKLGQAELYVLFRHMPLCGIDGQTLYDDLRKDGIRFFRLGKEHPLINVVDGVIEITVKDTAFIEQPLIIAVDRVVLIGKPTPPLQAAGLSGIIGESLDSEGFFQKDNIHLYPFRSFRRGIYYLGSCHEEYTDDEKEEEVSALWAEIHAPLLSGTMDFADGIRIDKGRCISCLTCYRVCPHHALDVSSGAVPVPMAPACVGCGMCAAVCPGNAIELVSRPKAEIFSEIDHAMTECTRASRTIVFSCARSGGHALKRAGAEGLVSTSDAVIVEIPCACALSEEMVLAALLRGADRVLVIGCHMDNCVSQKGTGAALRRIQRVGRYVETFENDGVRCLQYVALAPNEPFRSAHLVDSASTSSSVRREHSSGEP